MLTDDRGATAADAYTFAEGAVLAAGQSVLLCQKIEFQFEIDGDDTVFLLNADGAMVDTTGKLPGQGRLDKLWSRHHNNDAWSYMDLKNRK